MITDVYNLRDIQMFLSLLNQFEAEGVTDTRFVRQRCSNELTERAGKPGRVTARKRAYRSGNMPDYGKCPQCGKPLWPVDTGDGNVKIFGCWKCRFSKMVD